SVSRGRLEFGVRGSIDMTRPAVFSLLDGAQGVAVSPVDIMSPNVLAFREGRFAYVHVDTEGGIFEWQGDQQASTLLVPGDLGWSMGDGWAGGLSLGNVYAWWGANDGLRRAAFDNGTAEVAAAGGRVVDAQVGGDGSVLFIDLATPGRNELYRYDETATGNKVLLFAEDIDPFLEPNLPGGRVFVYERFTEARDRQRIWRVNASTGASEVVHSASSIESQYIASDENSIYWIDSRQGLMRLGLP
ncbi:MAG: hypothetical protein AAGN82_31105, partial [Myxococcota bacterium]